jgi:hypothetical protein
MEISVRPDEISVYNVIVTVTITDEERKKMGDTDVANTVVFLIDNPKDSIIISPVNSKGGLSFNKGMGIGRTTTKLELKNSGNGKSTASVSVRSFFLTYFYTYFFYGFGSARMYTHR